MADPLGVTASVVGVIVPALHGTRLLLEDLQQLKDAPQTVKRLVEDVHSVDTSLKLLQSVEDREWESLGVALAKQSEMTISSCTQACDVFRTDLRRWTKHSEDGKFAWQDRANVGFFKQGQIKAMSEQLQNCKLTINSVVSIATLYSSVRHSHITEEIKKAISTRQAEVKVAITTTDKQRIVLENKLAELNLSSDNEEAAGPKEGKAEALLHLEEERKAVNASWKLLEELLSKSQEGAIAKAVRNQSGSNTVTFGKQNSGFPKLTDANDGPTTERPETPPNPSAIIPFSRDTEFVGRGAILDQIHHICTAPGSWAALVGLGGVGKSQLAIEHAYRTRERSPDTWVFWVHASNAARFEQSFRDIANCVKIYGRQNPGANIFQLLHDWLLDERNGEWVLILDNADDAGFLVAACGTGQVAPANSLGDKQSRPIISYLPRCPNGSILITSRSRHAALQLVEKRDIVAVEPMSSADALALFQKKLGGHNGDGADVAELAAALDFMPLAIVQAAAYISQRAPRYSVRKYLQDFWKSDHKRTRLLDYEGEQVRRDWEAKNSIFITWQISFDHIREVRPSAADLLSLMSFFDRQGIPEDLLRNRSEQRHSRQDQKDSNEDSSVNETGSIDGDEDDASQSSVSDKFEDDVLALTNYSFISINTDGTTFEMHRLVQLATQRWLEVHRQRERWQQQFIQNLCVELPTGNYENWVKWQALFPHAKSAAAQQPKAQDSLRDWALILYRAAWYAWRMGNGVEAEKMSIQAMKVRKRILGREHEETLDSIAMVGLVYKLQGRWDAAEELEAQVMETRKKKLGAEYPDTLTSMANLASTYRNQGRWHAAEELEVQVMETRKKKLGADHPSTLTSMANLASTYWNQGRWDEAEELEVQVMETSKQTLGADHLETLTSINNLASTYWNQGRWHAAEELQVQVIETSKKKLGADHPVTLASINNLASTYGKQGRWDAAEELSMQVMETRKKKLGADHPDTLTSMSNLAWTWKGQNRDMEAISLLKECVQLQQRVLGVDHPDFISSSRGLARWEAEQRDIGGTAKGQRGSEELQLDLPDEVN